MTPPFVVKLMIYFVCSSQVPVQIFHEFSLSGGNKYKLYRSPCYFTQFKNSVDITCVSFNVTLFVTKLKDIKLL